MKIILSTLNAKYIHSSLALRYLKSYCEKQQSREIEIMEFSINEFGPDIMARLFRQNPDILCFSCYIWNIRMILEICHDIKQVSPRTLIILGGPEVSYDAANILQENEAVDFVVRGEGEATLHELLQALENQHMPDNIAGISYRLAGRIINNPDRALLSDLDQTPFPYPSDLGNYQDKIVYYESSRGCPFNCSYCLSSTQHGVRFFSLERVKRDLSLLMSQKVREIKFVDRTFNCNEKRAMEIMRYIIGQNPKCKIHFELDASLLSVEMLDFLQSVPPDLFNFEIGIQSTNQTALNSVNRKSDWVRQNHNIKRLQSYHNIHLHLDLIAGLPFESYREFAHSFNDVYALKPDVLQLGFLKLLKGSAIRNIADQHAYVFQQHAPYEVLSNRYLDYAALTRLKDIEELLEKYHNSGDMKQSLAYIIQSVYDNDAFAFFEEFADDWHQKKHDHIGHKKERLYGFLMLFIAERYADHKDVVNELLKYDFYLRNRTDLLPDHLWSFNPVDVNQEVYQYIKDQQFIQKNIPQMISKNHREIKKNLHLEYFRWDAEHAILRDNPRPLLFVYDPIKKQACNTIQL